MKGNSTKGENWKPSLFLLLHLEGQKKGLVMLDEEIFVLFITLLIPR